MEDIQKLINEGNPDKVVEALRTEGYDSAEFARLLIQKDLKHTITPLFSEPDPAVFGEIIGTKDIDLISGLFSGFDYCIYEIGGIFWESVRDIQKTGDTMLMKYFMAGVRFTELRINKFDFNFTDFKENPEITNDECSLEFEEAEKLLLLANDCKEDGHQENLDFLKKINFLLSHENSDGETDESPFRLNNADALSMEGGKDYSNIMGLFSYFTPYYFTLSNSGIARVDIDPDEFRQIVESRG